LRFILSLTAVLGVFVVGTIGYMIVDEEHSPSFGQAAYMTVITLSTVGFTEVWELSDTARLWTIGVITFGIVTVSLAFTSLVTLVVSGELRSLREREKMEKKVDEIHDHVLICGYGRTTTLVLKELQHRRMPMVVIEKDREREQKLHEADIPYIIGDATDEEVLLRGHLERARALVIGLPTDADNVFVVLTARALRPDMTIIARAEQPSTQAKLLRAGATRVICPQVIGASRIANILTRPTVVDFVEMANKGVELELDEYVLRDDSPLVGRTLRDSGVRRTTGAIVAAIKRADGQALVSPDPDARLAARDTLIFVGPAGVSSRLDAIDHVE
jgi:voltage-gated potassium channel